MPAFSGRYEYRSGDGSSRQSGACSLASDEETLRLAAAQGPGIAMDLGDIDGVDVADYQLSLKAYDGTAILLTQFGKTFPNLCRDLLESWRARVVQCLLLEDLEEIVRVDGWVQRESAERSFSSPAEIRLYKTNLAVLPTGALAFQWRLADVDALEFDEASYAIRLDSGKDRLVLGQLAKRSREFWGLLQERAQVLGDKSARVLHALFPFLSPGQFLKAAPLMKEGRVVRVSQLAAVHPLVGKALEANAVLPPFQSYFEALKGGAPAPGPYFGFKFLRKEEQEDAQEEGSGAEEREPIRPLLDLGEESLFCYFAFPLSASASSVDPAGFVAWECTSEPGRATYVFRVPGNEIDAAIGRLNRALVVVNFRREPIYLPDASLEIQPRFRRYAIAQRSIPALRELRTMFAGRAIHTSLDAWQNQLRSVCEPR